MKKLIALLLTAVMLLSLCACADSADTPETTTEPSLDVTATDADIAQLDALYADRQVYHGEFHDHADTGGTSDGNNTLQEWKDMMAHTKFMDFATIADHRQVLHMRLEEWDNSLFIGGTEAATYVTDKDIENNSLHYNMLFADPESLENVLNKYPAKFMYISDHFTYPGFTTAEFTELVSTVQEAGGFFVHVHPKGAKYMVSNDPLDYYFGEGMGLEVLCGYYGNMSAEENQKAYQLWTELLALGKRVYATSGSDSHRLSNTVSLTTIYSDEKTAQALLDDVRAGDFTAGPAGIRMSIGDTAMGGICGFENRRLVVSAGDFHILEYDDTHTYRVDVYDDGGLVFSQQLSGSDTAYFAIDTDATSAFYRAEVYDVTGDYIFALGNPIWNEALYAGK